MLRASLRRAALAALMLAVAGPAGAQPPQVVVTSAAPDAGGGTLTVAGENFGATPFVTLDLVPLAIRSSDSHRIVVAAPIALMPPGTYLLTVSVGPSPAESGSVQVVLGTKVEPAAQKAERASAARSAPANAPAEMPGATAFAAAGAEPAAKVGDRVITLADVDREWRRADPARYVGLSRDVYDARRRIVDALVADELIAREASARHMTPEALLAEEVPKRIVTMPESAVVSLYQSLGDLARGATLEQLRPALRAWLARITEPEIAKMNYVEELMKVSTRAEVFLAAPRVPIERAAQDASMGPDGAAVELVAFGDFQGLAYAKFAQAFGKVRDTFGDRVRVVFKNLPVLGPDSMAAAEAAECANAQGLFWPYHNRLVGQPGKVDAARLKQTAAEAGLNRDAFDACVERGVFRAMVRDAIDEAGRYGVKASPSFLVNGRLAPEPPPFLPPFDFFKRIIEEELSRLARKP